jgi:hypothetical protein
MWSYPHSLPVSDTASEVCPTGVPLHPIFSIRRVRYGMWSYLNQSRNVSDLELCPRLLVHRRVTVCGHILTRYLLLTQLLKFVLWASPCTLYSPFGRVRYGMWSYLN